MLLYTHSLNPCLWSTSQLLFHVSSMGRALAFRADDTGFEPRSDKSYTVLCWLECPYKMNTSIIFLSIYVFKYSSQRTPIKQNRPSCVITRAGYIHKSKGTFPFVARCLETINVCMWHILVYSVKWKWYYHNIFFHL